MQAKESISWRKIILYVLVGLFGVSLLSWWWPLIGISNKWKTVTHTEYEFSIDYPTKWKVQKYGENGFKGDDEVKLRIYHSLFEIFEISIYYQKVSEPTLSQVVSWGYSRISNTHKNLIRRGEPGYTEISLREDIINNHTVMRRRYQLGSAMYEDVYIARNNDMIIITLQAEENEFDWYLEDFEAIIVSFRPW